MDVITVLVSALPSIFASCVMLAVTRSQQKKEKQKEQHAKAQQRESMLSMKLEFATLKLSEANAIALRDGKCNGELKKAMEECDAAKKAYYEFLDAQAYEHITE